MEEYKLTPAQIEELESRGFDRAEIESAKIKVYRFEDWLDQKFAESDFNTGKVDAFYFNEDNKRTNKGEGELMLYLYPPRELEKIQQYKGEKLKGFEMAYFEALVESFGIKEKGSFEPILLAESELGKVKDLIGDKLPRCTTGSVYSNLTDEKFPSIWLQYRNDCGDNRNLAYWFKKVCVNGENRLKYVFHRHTTLTANELNSLHPDDLHFVVSALAFHRFKGYLEKKLLGNEDVRVEDFPLFPFFHDGQKLDLALRAAFETGLINEFSRWAHIGEKTNAVTMFWRAAVKTGLAKADSPVYKVIKAIEVQFSIPFGQNAIISTKQKKEIAEFGEDYKELYKALCDIMRP